MDAAFQLFHVNLTLCEVTSRLPLGVWTQDLGGGGSGPPGGVIPT